MLARSLLALSLVMSPLALVRGFVPHAPVHRLRTPALRAQTATIRMMAEGKAEVRVRVCAVGLGWCRSSLGKEAVAVYALP